MSSKMIVTNLRIEENLWLYTKVMAAEYGMSVNEYFNWLATQYQTKAQFGYYQKAKRAKTKKSIYETLSAIVDKKFKYQPMGASEDDKIIYGIK